MSLETRHAITEPQEMNTVITITIYGTYILYHHDYFCNGMEFLGLEISETEFSNLHF